jgi:tetratricopeptide (TPR) repeat protein
MNKNRKKQIYRQDAKPPRTTFSFFEIDQDKIFVDRFMVLVFEFLSSAFLFPWRLGVLAVVFAFVAPVGAQVTATGGLESPFELGGSARALGMGDTSVAITGSGDSFFGNPASLATLKQQEILTFHAPLFVDTIYDSIGYVRPMGSHEGFGLAFARLGTSNILETQNTIQAVSTFSSQQLEGLAGYGFRLIDKVDFGATVKYLMQQIDTYQGSGMGIDLGLLYHLSDNPKDFSQIGYRNFTFGFAASNVLQPQTKLIETTDQPIRIYSPAVSYLWFPSRKDSLWLTFEGEVPEPGNILFKAGAEYGINHMIFIRAGFDGTNPTVGAGLNVSDFEFDYAYNQSDLGALNRFSLSYHFETYRDPLQTQKIDLLKWVANSYTKTNEYDPAIQAWKNVLREFPDDEESRRAIQELQKRRAKALKDQIAEAKAAIARRDFDRALPLIAKIFSLDPGNPEAKDLLKQVDKNLLISTNYLRGVESYTKEDYGSAVQYLQMVYELDPHYRDINFLYHDAQSHYLPLESMSKDLTDLYAKGVSFYMNGQYQKAIDTWEKVLEKNPKNFLVQRNLEEARNRLKDKGAPAPEKKDNKE